MQRNPQKYLSTLVVVCFHKLIGYALVRVVYTWSGALPSFVFFKTAIGAGPVPPILYSTDY
jgi:hypothetical protein